MVSDDWPVIPSFGIGAVLISVFGILGAIHLAPWFSPVEHPLSDLGRYGRPSAPLFNGALILSGTLGLGFIAGLRRRSMLRVSRVGLTLFGVAAAFVVLIGVFPTPHPFHYPVAVGFYLTLTFALFVHGTEEVIARRIWFGLIIIWLGILHTAAWVFWWRLMEGVGIAGPETIGAAVFSLWVGGMVCRRFRDSLIRWLRRD